MTYATLMVHMELGRANDGLLAVAASLAVRLDASVIGIAARQPVQVIYTDGCYISPDVIQQDRDQVEREFAGAEAEFRGAMQLHPKRLQWRSMVTTEKSYAFVAREARSADLVLTSKPPPTRLDPEQVTAGQLVMELGRPVLVVPPQVAALPLEHAVLAWKDTREARRAALDAVPLLKLAKRVTVIEVIDDEARSASLARLSSVADWLGGHGVAADTLAAPSGNDSHLLQTLCRERHADLVVAGAYGHSRLREWALGGVTRDLLLHAECCTLLSR